MPVLWIPILSFLRCSRPFDFELRCLLEMKQLNDLFHVADFMREEFDNGLVAAHFAQMAKNVEESVDFVRDIVGLSCNSLANIDLQEFHDRRHECIQDRV